MQIRCPYCLYRDEIEFVYGGEAHIVRPESATDSEWAQYLFYRNNTKGLHAERWRHARGCGQWFHAVRNTMTHELIAVYRVTDPRPGMTDGSTP